MANRIKNKIKLIACRALDPLLHLEADRVILPIRLHLSRERLQHALMEEIRRQQAKGFDIVLGYGLCGRALEGVYSEKSRLILPRVDDCVGAVLGSRQRHQAILSENTGCFFLEPSWIGTEVDIFSQCLKGLDKIPEEYRDEIVDLALRHYSKLALIDHGLDVSSPDVLKCHALAKTHHLEFVRYRSDLSLLTDLVEGNWTEDRFVIVEPGQKIPFF